MRIIAGLHRGRRLVAPHGLETRPTSDRVREALFSSLGPLPGAVVLDLYAGTGALGLEALSRGAVRVVFVEEARAAIAAIRTNIATLDVLDATRVVAQTVTRAASALAKGGPFHLVFADPPYALLAEVPKALTVLLAAGAIAPGGRVVIEHSRKDAPPAVAGLTLRSTRFYGTTAVSTYVHLTTSAEAALSEAPPGEVSPDEAASDEDASDQPGSAEPGSAEPGSAEPLT